ncbi:SRPBCC family protein [Terrabacter sp. 2RAF25]|uniref:SRPBCC family protein n=1 Tax=Terrabacter sp. 2RAF25 TaxID=3232998 RepID=UPI003F9C6C6D
MSELTQVLGRIERGDDAVAVVFDRHYATSATDLWGACTDPDRLVRWFAPVTGDLHEGGEFTIHFDDADTPACRIVECKAPQRLVWEWPVKDMASLVRVGISTDGDGARLTLRHERLAPTQAPGYAAGWDTYIRSLAAHLAGTDAPDWGITWSELHELYAGGAGSDPY